MSLSFTPVVSPPGCVGVEEAVVREAGWHLWLDGPDPWDWDSWQGQVIIAWFGGARPMRWELRCWLLPGCVDSSLVRAGEARLRSQRPPVAFRR